MRCTTCPNSMWRGNGEFIYIISLGIPNLNILQLTHIEAGIVLKLSI